MLNRARLVTLGMFFALSIPAQEAAANDPVTEWNLIAVSETLSAVPAQAPVRQTRTMAIVQVSVHDAINAITREYQTYSSPVPGSSGATADAAAIGAAHHALISLFPARADALDAMRAASLETHGVSVQFHQRRAGAALRPGLAHTMTPEAMHGVSRDVHV